MSNYYLSCCSTADLSAERMKERDFRHVCFHFSVDGEEYSDDFGNSLSTEELFKRMLAGAEAKTSQVSIEDYISHFESMLSEGKDVLHIAFSSGLSGSYNAACLARDEVAEKYPDRKLYVVDSLAASSGYGLMMDTLADMRDEGKSIDELYNWIEENKLGLHHWFFSSDLTFFVRGGRVSKAAGFVGTVLNICPLLNVDVEGHLAPREKIRSKKKVIKQIVQKMIELAENGLQYSGKCFISHSLCEEDAKAVANLIEEQFPNLNGKVELYPIGATIGSHTGPGTVALFFWGQKRTN